MLKQDLLSKYADPIPVLDQGYVKLVDVMGDDRAVVEAARTSYVGHDLDEPERTREDDVNLIRYLFRAGHSTPFEMIEIKLQIRIPMDAWRQMIRHRTASVSEYSTRYRPAINALQKTPVDGWRMQSNSSKQGSAGLANTALGEQLSREERELHLLARSVYQSRLECGIAREQARKDLPLSNYTEAVWKVDGNNLLKFLRLRLDPHAQLEIRRYAEAIFEIVKDWIPITAQAFTDYALEGRRFSRFEVELIKDLLHVYAPTEEARSYAKEFFDVDEERTGVTISKRERAAFLRTFGLLPEKGS